MEIIYLNRLRKSGKLCNFHGEESRMQYYVSTYCSYVGNKRYDLAYEVLSEEFKKQYFNTYEKFENYAKQKYSICYELSYGDIQRVGELYIIDVTIHDDLQEKEDINTTFIIQELDFNKYKMSFSI